MKVGKNENLLVGIGNSLRGDDALGILLAEYFQTSTATETILVTQLQTELLDSFLYKHRVIFADASTIHKIPELKKISDVPIHSNASSHQMDVPMLVKLFRQLYPAQLTEFYTLALPAFQFELGTGLSLQAGKSLELARQILHRFLDSPH